MGQAVLKPVADRIIVIESPHKKETKGGIVLPTGSRVGNLSKGLVAAVGEGRIDINGNRVPLSVKKGDWVLFYHNTGVPVEEDEENSGEDRPRVLLMHEDDVLAVMEEVPEEQAA